MFTNLCAPFRLSLRSCLQAYVALIAFVLVLTSCDSVLNGNLPRTSELLSQPTPSQQNFVIQNSSGNTAIKSVTARFVVMSSSTGFVPDSIPTTTGSISVPSGGIGLISNQSSVILNGKPVAVFDQNGLLLPTVYSTTWEGQLQVHNIKLDITPNSPIGDSLSANIEALPLPGSTQNQKLLTDFKIGINSLKLDINCLQGAPPAGLLYKFLQTPNWEYTSTPLGINGPGTGSWVRDINNKTITYLCSSAVSTIVGGNTVVAIVIGQYVISY